MTTCAVCRKPSTENGCTYTKGVGVVCGWNPTGRGTCFGCGEWDDALETHECATSVKADRDTAVRLLRNTQWSHEHGRDSERACNGCQRWESEHAPCGLSEFLARFPVTP